MTSTPFFEESPKFWHKFHQKYKLRDAIFVVHIFMEIYLCDLCGGLPSAAVGILQGSLIVAPAITVGHISCKCGQVTFITARAIFVPHICM